ncbi:hypothetical protein DIE14_31255 [Burkholderia sp. Bp9017]|nr:hypothetical protein DIE14_31255 [Burkholderia sp. Bp9017]RQZ28460.1 hypothetical protein DIE13_27980 [Burkholderia sp. Bp9016]
MRGSNVVRMKKAGKGDVADATIGGRCADLARLDHARRRRKTGKAAAHAQAIEESDADTTTGGTVVQANRAEARIPAAGRFATAGTCPGTPELERAAHATPAAPTIRPALLIQPCSLFCILLVGELPTDFPDRAVGESRV